MGRANHLRRVVLGLTLLLAATSARAGSAGSFLFMDPDANQDVVLDVIKSFNALFEANALPLTLQPQQSPESLEAGARPDYAIIGARFESFAKKLDMEPVLLSQSNGSVYFYKVLVSSDKLPKDLSKKVVAAAVSPDKAAEVQALLTKHGYNAQDTYVLGVAKDIDAIFAMTFGEANAALVTTETVSVLKKVNPAVSAGLNVAFKSDPELRAALYVSKRRLKAQDKLVDLFTHLDQSAEGRELLRLTAVDKWVPYHSEVVEK